MSEWKQVPDFPGYEVSDCGHDRAPDTTNYCPKHQIKARGKPVDIRVRAA